MDLIVRADDLGYSKAVSLGIAEAVEQGIINNVGLMVNMEASAFGAALLKGADICLGMHANISAGRPVLDSRAVPSLVHAEGGFRSSASYREAKQDVVLEEAVAEAEAQYRRFLELTGGRPAYIDGHAVNSRNFLKALEIVAAKYQIPYCPYPEDGHAPVRIEGREVYLRPGSTCGTDARECLERAVEDKERLSLVVYHPGYLDAAIMRGSSLNLPRIYELEMLCSEETKQYLASRGVRRLRLDGWEER